MSPAPLESYPIDHRLVALIGWELNVGQFEYLWPTLGQVIYKVTLREHWNPNYERPEETPYAASRLLRQWFLGSLPHVEEPIYRWPIQGDVEGAVRAGLPVLERNLQKLKAAAFERQRRR